LETLARHKTEIKAVVTDILMPGVDGLKLIRALRDERPDLSIIVSSGVPRGVGDQVRKELEEMGIRTFLAKPYAANKLLSVLHELSLARDAPTPEAG
jgi:two-component system, cell cycle sensor histidine kinase and response regulator CckA